MDAERLIRLVQFGVAGTKVGQGERGTVVVVQVFETSYAAGFLTALVVGAALSALLCAIGWHQVRERVTVLGRSQQALVRNLRWIKKVLERSRITRRNSIDNSWRTVT